MKKLLTGNEAIALGAYEAGITYAAACPAPPQYRDIGKQC